MINGRNHDLAVDKQQRLVGAFLIRPDLLGQHPALAIDHFVDWRPKLVFTAIRNLEHRGTPISVDSVHAELVAQGSADALSDGSTDGSRTFLAKLVAQEAIRPDHVDELADAVIADAAKVHYAIHAAEQASPAAASPPFITVRDALREMAKLADAPVLATPFPTLNRAIGFGGFLGGQKYDVPASTGRGKTTFVNQIAREAAKDRDVIIAFYEAFAGYGIARMAAGPLGMHSNEIIREAARHGDAVLRVVPERIHLLNRPTIATMRNAVDYLSQRSGMAPILIVDYAQKLADHIQASQSRPDARLAGSEASEDLLKLADATKAPVISVSSMSRVNGRRAKDPRTMAPYELVDVAKESGSIEYDSAGVIVLSLADEHDGDERLATITVAKARFGEEMHIDARYDGRRGVWRDLGPVEGVSKEPEESLHDKLRDALATPAKNRSELQKRVRGSKARVLAAIDELIGQGDIRQTSRGLELEL